MNNLEKLAKRLADLIAEQNQAFMDGRTKKAANLEKDIIHLRSRIKNIESVK